MSISYILSYEILGVFSMILKKKKPEVIFLFKKQETLVSCVWESFFCRFSCDTTWEAGILVDDVYWLALKKTFSRAW